jgi:hypothetical protein
MTTAAEQDRLAAEEKEKSLQATLKAKRETGGTTTPQPNGSNQPSTPLENPAPTVGEEKKSEDDLAMQVDQLSATTTALPPAANSAKTPEVRILVFHLSHSFMVQCCLSLPLFRILTCQSFRPCLRV